MDTTNNPYQTPAGQLDTDDHAFGEIKFFSPSIRIGRLRYLAHGFIFSLGVFVGLMILSMIVGVIFAVSGADMNSSMWFFMALGGLFYIAIFAVAFILMIQRLHDLNHSGWLSLLMLVPLVNIVFALYILFAPGTKGRNNYGLQPPPNQTWHWIVGLAGPVLGMIMFVGILAAVAIPAYQDYVERANTARDSANQYEQYEDDYDDSDDGYSDSYNDEE